MPKCDLCNGTFRIRKSTRSSPTRTHTKLYKRWQREALSNPNKMCWECWKGLEYAKKQRRTAIARAG